MGVGDLDHPDGSAIQPHRTKVRGSKTKSIGWERAKLT
jgi:hypothetical protein